MKKFTTFILLLLLSVNLYAQKKKAVKDVITIIGFESFGRRGSIEINVTKDSAISSSRTEKKFILVTKAKWNGLLKSLRAVNLSTINKLKPPTRAREYDGALHCRLFMVTKKSKYETPYFDCGKPMKQLQVLYDKLDAIRNELNEHGELCKE